MGEADAIAWHILAAGAAEQFENPLLVTVSDSSSVVFYLERRQDTIAAALDGYLSAPRRFHVFDRIVEKVADDLLKGQLVGLHFRQGADTFDLDLGLIKSMPQ